MDILLRAYNCAKYFLLALQDMWLSRLAEDWPQVAATVRHFYVEPKTFPIEVTIVYTYSFQGKPYAANVTRGVLWGERFPEGRATHVHVDPQHPLRSYLPTEIDKGWLLLGGVVGLAFAALLLYVFVRHIFGRHLE